MFHSNCLSSVVIPVVLFVMPTAAFAVGGNHPPGRLELDRPNWPETLPELVNAPDRIQGHWVNQNDYFFFRGSVSALNEFISNYSQVEDTPLAVTLHAGALPTTGPLGEPRHEPFNWKLVVQRRGWGAPRDPRRQNGDPSYIVTLHVWLTGNITLDRLHIPKHVEVLSGYEIEQFILAHRTSALAVE